MMFKKFMSIFFPLILTACGEIGPELDLYHIAIQTEPVAEIAMGLHSAEITIDGNPKEIVIDLVGEFDSYSLSDDIPDWMTVTTTPYYSRQFTIHVAGLGDGGSRTGEVGFIVSKDKKSQSGTITITQKPEY